jgi:hypothetical protein
MGYLDNTSVTVDSILTKKGRERLSQGRNSFQITRFALGDDEVDYTLWNPSHTLGSSYYGEQIENMPVLEAITDESYALKYKLLTLDKNTISLPSFTVSPANISIPQASVLGGTSGVRAAVRINISGYSQPYTVTLLEDSLGEIEAIDQDSFVFRPVDILTPQQDQNTSIVIVGNQTGGRVEIPVTITTTLNSTSTVATPRQVP